MSLGIIEIGKLLAVQKVLDRKIYDRFPGLKNEPWEWKITALLTEIGECANEWRGFKKWSVNQTPVTKKRIYKKCSRCDGRGEDPNDSFVVCLECKGDGTLLVKITNPLLEEYVDILHFLLSIGLEIKTDLDCINLSISNASGTLYQFNNMFIATVYFDHEVHTGNKATVEATYLDMWAVFKGLGTKLGFTWAQVEAAYYAKNEINHARQDGGY